MARKKLHIVHVPNPSKKNFVGIISLREIAETFRKPLPPPTQTHRSAKDYRRKPKHPGAEME